jgi:hypothetical protein
MTKINKNEYYSINQIEKNGWLFGFKFMTIRKLVLTGLLPAIQHRPTKDSQVRYRILGKDILDYIEKNKK